MRGAKLSLVALGVLGLVTAQAHAGDITFWTWRQEDRAAFTELFNDFTKANPDIHVKFEAFAPETYATVVSAALAGGKGGDVLSVRAYGGLEQFAKAGYLLPLDAQTVPELANLPADAKAAETLRSDGRVYAVPFASQTLGVFDQQGRVRQGRRAARPRPGTSSPALVQDAEGQGHRRRSPTAPPPPGWTRCSPASSSAPLLGPHFVRPMCRRAEATFEDPRYAAALGRS